MIASHIDVAYSLALVYDALRRHTLLFYQRAHHRAEQRTMKHSIAPALAELAFAQLDAFSVMEC